MQISITSAKYKFGDIARAAQSFATQMMLYVHPTPDNKGYSSASQTRWIPCRLANHGDIRAKEKEYHLFESLSQHWLLRLLAG